MAGDVCRLLISHLINGDWVEGDRLPPERELGRQLNVGRASLREALKAMEVMGLIESRVGEGTFVRSRSDFFSQPLLWAIAGGEVSDIREIVEARITIESSLAASAAERSTAEDIAEIGRYLDEMAAADGNRESFQQADISFHLAIANSAHNRILLNAVHLIRNVMQQWIGEALQTGSGIANQAVAQHEAIFMAIAKRDPEQARVTMERHLHSMSEPFLRAHPAGAPASR